MLVPGPCLSPSAELRPADPWWNHYLEHVVLRGPAGGGVGDVADGAVGLHRHDPHGNGHRRAREHRRVQHITPLREEEENASLNLGLESCGPRVVVSM